MVKQRERERGARRKESVIRHVAADVETIISEPLLKARDRRVLVLISMLYTTANHNVIFSLFFTKIFIISI